MERTSGLTSLPNLFMTAEGRAFHASRTQGGSSGRWTRRLGMIEPCSHRRSLNWPGAVQPIQEEDILAVVSGLDSQSRERLGEIAKAFNVDEVSVLIWLMECSFSGAGVVVLKNAQSWERPLGIFLRPWTSWAKCPKRTDRPPVVQCRLRTGHSGRGGRHRWARALRVFILRPSGRI